MAITLLAVVLASGLGWLGAQLAGWWGFPFGGVSSIAVFGTLYFAFDRFLWRRSFLRRFLLVPDLNGAWEVTGRTIIKNGTEYEWHWDGEIRIAQSWSKIRIVLKTAKSASKSIAASLYREPGEGYRLIYHYDNTPTLDRNDMHRHCGLCDLVFDDGASEAVGKYFTDRDRLTVGTMTLCRKGTNQ